MHRQGQVNRSKEDADTNKTCMERRGKGGERGRGKKRWRDEEENEEEMRKI